MGRTGDTMKGGGSRVGMDLSRNRRKQDNAMRQRMGKREKFEGRKDKKVGGQKAMSSRGGEGDVATVLQSVLAVGAIFLMFMFVFVLVWWASQPDDDEPGAAAAKQEAASAAMDEAVNAATGGGGGGGGGGGE